MTRTSTIWRRAVTLAMPAACAALLQSGVLAQNATPSAQVSGCGVGGIVTASRIPLPGVVVSLTTGDDQPVDVSSSGPDGAYAIKVPTAGKYKLTGELVAFAPVTHDVTIDDANCRPRVDLAMTLASRTPLDSARGRQAAPAAALPSTTVANGAQAPGGGRGQNGRAQGGRGQQGQQQFQSLSLLADQAGLARSDDNANVTESVAQALLPPGFSAETSAESVTSFGTTQGSESFFGPNGPGDRLEQMREAFGGGGDPSGLNGFQGGRGDGGGRGGPGGGRGGDGGGFG
ncbi:MAG: hypothetical protein DMF91_17030, partial [Acidobacteria bacterium]